MNEIYEQNAEAPEEVSDRNVERPEEIYDQNSETTEGFYDQDAEPGEDNSVQDMKDSLGDMMQMETPLLDTVETISLLPFRILTNRIILISAIQVLIPAYAWKEALVYAGCAAGSLLAGVGVELLKDKVKKASESDITSELADIFQKEEMSIYSFDKSGEIPLYMLSHQHLIEGFDGAVSGDLISLRYREYSIVCCNVALTQTSVDGFHDGYTEDDDEAKLYFEIPDGQSVVYYGSVFMFFPGPDIEGSVRLAAESPLYYLRDLKNMDPDSSMTGPECLEQRMESFHKYHFMEGDNKDNQAETEQVFTQRVKDMILQLEWQTRAPVSVYADKNLVCITIQDRVYDFQCIHNMNDPAGEVAEALYGKIISFKNILDRIIGPEGSEYTELLGNPAEQGKSVYAPFYNPFHNLKSPEDDDIRAYVQDLAEWSTDIYRFMLHYSREYEEACEKLDSVGAQFLEVFLANNDLVQTRIWLETDAGIKLKDSLTRAAVSHFRYLWNAPGKFDVRNICRKGSEGNAGRPVSEITFDIVVNPPIRKWEYLPITNQRLAGMCGPSLYSLNQLNTEKTRMELVNDFSKNLKHLISLQYDMDYIYSASITINKGEKYGMKPEKINEFCKWYAGLMAENMEFNGEPFTLGKDETGKAE